MASLHSLNHRKVWFYKCTRMHLLQPKCCSDPKSVHQQVTRTQRRTSASTSLSPYLAKWNLLRYLTSLPTDMDWVITQQHWKLLCIVEHLSVVLIFLCNRPAGIVQISGSPRVGSGYAHHHLRCDQTCSWHPCSQSAEVTSTCKVEM